MSGVAQWHVIMCKLKGVELMRCGNGCLTSLGTELACVFKEV